MAAKRKKLSNDDFIKRWWKRRFRGANPPTWDSAISCADASDLLEKFRAYLKAEVKS